MFSACKLTPDTIRLEVGQIDKSNNNNAQVKTGEVIFIATQ